MENGNRITISVVIPLYNQGQFLLEAIESVCRTGRCDTEIIVVNDGTDDGSLTPEIRAEAARLGVRLIDQENAGPGAARDAGTRVAQGEFVMYLDADDAVEPDFIGKSLSVLRADPKLGFAYSDMRLFGSESGLVRHPEYSLYRLLFDNFLQPTFLMRRRAWEESGGNPLSFGYEDWSLFLNLGRHGWHGRRIPEPLFRYRVHPASATNRAIREHRRLERRIRAAYPDLYSRESVARLKREWGGLGMRESLILSAKRLTRNGWFPASWRRRLKSIFRER